MHISQSIAHFPFYRYALIEHCTRVKLQHWDIDIRLLAAKALARMTKFDPSYMMDTVIPRLLQNSVSSDLFTRHGNTMALAEVLVALSEIPCPLYGELKRLIRQTVFRIEKKRLYRGRGGEIMRAAVCRLIECMALARLALGFKTQLRLIETLEECLRHPNETIRTRAVSAYRAFAQRYFPKLKDETSEKDRVRKLVVETYLTHLETSKNVAFRRGYALAVGATPKCLFTPELTRRCITTLANAIELEENVDDRDAREKPPYRG